VVLIQFQTPDLLMIMTLDEQELPRLLCRQRALLKTSMALEKYLLQLLPTELLRQRTVLQTNDSPHRVAL
jgi:hypothetical protein